jgi:hypothetical protein
VHVRLNVDDVRQMGGTAPFGWSSYRFDKEGDVFVYRQNVGSSAAKSVGDVGWKGEEVVAFRLHLPSRIVYHNAGADNLKRGNILVWEQRFDARTRGEPLTLDARMESQSILYRTLILFGGTVAVVGAGFSVLLWLIMRRGHRVAGRASRPDGAPNASDPRREASVR